MNARKMFSLFCASFLDKRRKTSGKLAENQKTWRAPVLRVFSFCAYFARVLRLLLQDRNKVSFLAPVEFNGCWHEPAKTVFSRPNDCLRL